jgi:hypothetical protein
MIQSGHVGSAQAGSRTHTADAICTGFLSGAAREALIHSFAGRASLVSALGDELRANRHNRGERHRVQNGHQNNQIHP